MADELGALEKEYALAIAPFEMKLPRIKALKEALQSACPASADAEWIIEGAHFGVKLGPRANESLIDYAKLIKKIGLAAFAKIATCTLTNLRKSVKPELLKGIVSTEQCGPRKLSTFEKGAA
jgi:hypothetical protein